MGKYIFNVAKGFLGKAHGIQSKEQCRHTFLNLILKGKFCEAVRFVFSWETGGLQPNKLVEY